MEFDIQKYWIEGKAKKNCFMLYARDLAISLAEFQTNNNWSWFSDLDQTSRFETFGENNYVFSSFHLDMYICLQ